MREYSDDEKAIIHVLDDEPITIDGGWLTFSERARVAALVAPLIEQAREEFLHSS
jgi:hypothetical protein